MRVKRCATMNVKASYSSINYRPMPQIQNTIVFIELLPCFMNTAYYIRRLNEIK